MGKAELLEKVTKVRRKKLEEELTNIIERIIPHVENLIPLANEHNSMRERYARLKIEPDTFNDLFDVILKEKSEVVYNELVGNNQESFY